MIDYTELVKALRGLANGIWKNCEYTWFSGEEKVFADAADEIEALVKINHRFRELLDNRNKDVAELQRKVDELTSQFPKRGEWIKHPEVKNIYGGVYIECPFCGEKYVVQNVSDEKFCRNCGADMREKMEVQE